MYTFKEYRTLKMAGLLNASRLNEKQQAWLLKRMTKIKLRDVEELFFYLSDEAVSTFWTLFSLVNCK